jgi:hypothetical protein
VDIEVIRHRFTSAVPITADMQALVAEAAENCGMAWEPLASGAGHDAQAVANIAPVAMIFVPSIDGISLPSKNIRRLRTAPTAPKYYWNCYCWPTTVSKTYRRRISQRGNR